MVLAEPGGAIAVLLEDLADSRRLFTDDAVVAREAGRLFRNYAEAHRVVIAAGDQGGPRRRAERGGVELGIAQAGLGNAVQGWRGDGAAKGAGGAETDVVGHDQQHVRRALGRHHAGGHQGFDWAALRLITPPNFGAGGGRVFVSSDLVAEAEPDTPCICWA